jgi:CheY-like chemotaxis protein
LQRFRASGQYKDVPVLIITSSDAPSDQQWAQQSGVNFFRKPANLEEFLKVGEMVQHLLLSTR